MAEFYDGIEKHSMKRIARSVIFTERLRRGPDCGAQQPFEPIPFQFRRFEMLSALAMGYAPNVESAIVSRIRWDGDVSRYDDDPWLEFTAYDFQHRFSKMATPGDDEGAMGFAIKPHDKPDWEILTMETPADFFGTLNAPLTQEMASVSVAAVTVLGHYNVFGNDHGLNITAFNPVGGGNFASYWHAGFSGDAVFCRWDMTNSKYWILAVEPNNKDFQNQTVVTDVTFDGGGHVTGLTKKTIQLPPWTSIT